MDGLARLCEGWSPEQHVELAALLTWLSTVVLGDGRDRHLLTR